MDAFSPTLGLEQLDRANVISVIGDDNAEIVPQDWDSLSAEERSALLLDEENQPEHLESSSGGILGQAERLPRTLAFTVLALGQIFHVMAIHRGEHESFFTSWFKHNRILLVAVISTFLLQLGVIYLPLFQQTFETLPLSGTELTFSIGLASLILFAVEVEKYLRRRFSPADAQ
jgi:magnesium-transporting ATPase (P-type)